MTILYADDDFDDRSLLVEAFREIDPAIHCIEACDGSQAINLLKRTAQLPDFIFLDINMPVMGGRECLVELKKDEKLQTIPVIIYSTTNDPFEIKNFYQLGASLFINKPDTFSKLFAVLNRFLETFQVKRQFTS